MHQKIWRLYVMTMAVCLVLSSAWFFGYYKIMRNKIAHKKSQIIAIGSLIQTVSALKKKCLDQKHAIQALKGKEYSYKNNALSTMHPLARITDAADAVGITFSHCTLHADCMKKEVERQSMSCQCLATIDQIAAFFDYLYANKSIVKCRELKMQADRGAEDVINTKKQLFEVQCVVRMYTKKSPSTVENS